MLKVNNLILKDGCAETFSRLLDKGYGAIYCRSLDTSPIFYQFLDRYPYLKLFRKSFQIANPIEEDLIESITQDTRLSNPNDFREMVY